MIDTRWRYWQVFGAAGDLEWVGISRPDAHPRIDRVKVWTFLPDSGLLVANWFISQDHQRAEPDREWVHDGITGWEFCDAAIATAAPPAAALARITRPEAVLTLGQIDRIPLAKVVGAREADRIRAARRDAATP